MKMYLPRVKYCARYWKYKSEYPTREGAVRVRTKLSSEDGGRRYIWDLAKHKGRNGQLYNWRPRQGLERRRCER